jgi:pimeloyl-ACP methyl ester carboxylesterase
MIVYLGGTFSSPNQSLPQNLPTASSDLKPEQLDAVERALNGDTTIPIMLVGFSQGGMDAQNMAIKAPFRGQVTAVVTYAAPMVEVMPKTLTFIDLVDKGDLVPHLPYAGQPFYYSTADSNGQIFEFESANDNALIYQIPIFNVWPKLSILHGDRTTYEQVGQAFDKAAATNDQYAQVRNNIDFFMSGIVQPDFTTGA